MGRDRDARGGLESVPIDDFKTQSELPILLLRQPLHKRIGKRCMPAAPAQRRKSPGMQIGSQFAQLLQQARGSGEGQDDALHVAHIVT